MTTWRPDVLGDGFECTDLDLGADEAGELVATLVRSLPDPLPTLKWWQRLLGREPRPRLLENVDVLYVHGWSDYFFQKDLARFFTSRGARFFALDLRRYGRSLREGQSPGYIENLDDYDAEIGLAHELICAGAGKSRRLVLLGHSTGGLVLSLWAARHPDAFDALALNSPWLEFQLSGAARQALLPLVSLSARINAHDAIPQLDYGFYSRAQREVCEGDAAADINLAWRPERAHAVQAGWLRAILAGHARVSQGLGIEQPALVLLSARWEAPLRWSETFIRADTVLDVDQVAQASLKLGQTVTVERIDGALHDIFLSASEPRADAYSRLERWLIGWQVAFEHKPSPKH